MDSLSDFCKDDGLIVSLYKIKWLVGGKAGEREGW